MDIIRVLEDYRELLDAVGDDVTDVDMAIAATKTLAAHSAQLAAANAAREAAKARLVTAASLLRQSRRFIDSASGAVGYGKALINAIDAALSVWGLPVDTPAPADAGATGEVADSGRK